jgi:glutamate---cysteine ligase / carboxylate-amine ligase
LIDSGFGSAAAWSLGVEEEFFLVDVRTFDTAPVFSELVRKPGPRLKPEVFECLLEATTPVCRNVGEALAEMRALRETVQQQAEVHDVTILASGTHPLALGGGQPIVPLPRYRRMTKELGDAIYRQLVCGLHVHVSVPDPETCLRAFEGVVPWLPVVLALSANSPFVEGEETGFRSTRAERLLEMPTGGTPPLLPTWSEWEAASRGDESRRHWDAWPRPGYGTLEVRVADQQTDVRRSAGFAALIQSLVLAVSTVEARPYDRRLYARRRGEAAREAPDPAEVAALAELVEPSARELGGWSLVEEVLARRPEAERQLELGPAGALQDAVQRSLELAS